MNRGQVRNVYLQKRKAQGLMTIEQVAEWAPQYSLEIQRTIRYIGMKIIDENESVEKAYAILKIWGRCSANHHKSQAISFTYVEIMVVLQMEQIQTKDRHMGITPMVSCHSRHHCQYFLFISISKLGYGSRQN